MPSGLPTLGESSGHASYREDTGNALLNSHVPQTNSELQNLLIDERLRCETHKTNYQTLKEEHKKLQNEFVQLQNELARVQEGKAESSENLQKLVHSLQAQLATKSRELEEVRSQTMHPHKLEVIKAEITKELEEPLKAHMLIMDKEVEKYRAEYNKLRYEFTFLKAEYDHAKTDHARTLDELKLRYQSQISALQKERDNLLEMQKNPTDLDGEKNLQLHRQKTQLEQRVKHLLEEIAELQKQKEKIAVDADLMQRTQAKEVSQLRANYQILENDKRSCDMQSERYQKELRDTVDHVSRLNQQIQNLNRECASLKNQADEQSHRHKVALTNEKLEALKIKGELERERDSLLNKTTTLETELELLRDSVEKHQKDLDDLERDAVLRVQKAKEEEWASNNALQNEKIELEEACRDLQLRLDAEKSTRVSDRDESEEKIRSLEMNEINLNAELSQLKRQLEVALQAKAEMDEELEESIKTRQKLFEREQELQTMTSLRKQGLAEVERLKEAIRDLRSDVESARNQAQRAQNEAEKSIEAGKLVALEEKHRLQSRLDQLEYKMKRNAEAHEKANKHQKRVKHALVDKVKNMKKKVELLEAQKEQLEIELKAGRHGVSVEEHNKIRRRLRDIKRRHNEFRHVIGLGNYVTQMDSNGGGVTDDVLGVSGLSNITKNDDSLHRKEVSLVLKRLDEIAEKQKEQMEALDAVALPQYPLDNAHASVRHSIDSNRRNYSTADDKSSEKSAPATRRSEYEDDFTSSSND